MASSPCAMPGCAHPSRSRTASPADEAYLLLEFLELKSQGDFAALGRMLANAHRTPGPRFGWHARQLHRLDAAAERLVRRLGGVLADAAHAAAARAGKRNGFELAEP